MNLTKFSIDRPIGICMAVAFFVVLGLFSFYRIGVELLPALNTPYVTVSVNYDGANAESIEQQVVKPMEDALSSVSNLKHMTSTASYGQARITLELDFSANADAAAIDATKKINAIRGKLPDGIDEPVVIKRDVNATPIMYVAVQSGKPLDDIYSMVENDFQDVIQQADGVSEMDLNGGRDKEIAVEIDKDKLIHYDMTLTEVVNALKSENILMPSGTIYSDATTTDVRVKAQYTDEHEISQIQVTNAQGVKIPLTAVATIKRQDQRVTRYARVNGTDAVVMAIYKNSDANVVSTVDNINKKLETLRQDNPDYTFTVTDESASYVRNSLNNTLHTLIEGLITTGTVLFFFLRGWRSTLAVMIAIPTSLIATFFVMYMAGFTFNMMSLMGMALCVGILVDDSIVVLENIHRHLMKGELPRDAALNGRMEIGMAAIAITLCDVVVFLPIAFMTGMVGQYFKQFGLTIVFATLFSMFVSFTLTPMLASRLFRLGLKIPDRPLWRRMDTIENWARDHYSQILIWSLDHSKRLFIPVCIFFLAAVALIPSGLVGSEFMPQTDESGFRITLQLPTNANLDRTDKATRQLEAYLNTLPEVTYYTAMVGGRSLNEANIQVTLKNRQDRSRSIWQITNDVRDFAAQNVLDGDVRVKENQASVSGTSGGYGGGSGNLRLELRGKNTEELISKSREIQKIMQNDITGVRDVSSSYEDGMPEYQLDIDRTKLKQYGTSLGDLTNTFSNAISGQKAGVLANDPKNDNNDTDIYVRLKGSDGFHISDLETIPLNASNRLIYVADVAKVRAETGPVTIRRTDKERSITLGSTLQGRPLNDVIQELTATLNGMDMKGITYRFTGQADQMTTTFKDLGEALLLSLILIYMILAILYESVKTPFIRMLSLPLGLIGSLFLLFLTNNTINLYSLIGILVMDGIVAKNGTLLLDYTLTLMGHGMDPRSAIIEAGRVRLRPIFMTTLTMIVGLLPTALSMTAGSETRSSMAVVVIGGLLTSTVFTLVIIPIIFIFLETHKISLPFLLKKKISGNHK
ncbi:multidrug transporter [Megasphaera cerevisiae DSM 20462]|uniref:Multidrug transporter n=1 Tax=Megasphaera cerevisiae DSM 20462 TaxID=1122219 RepID=A0A0J6WV24_9FIRM|nr:efflux RND transporter permease subunit [Megasphaera cerevisiae]KMO86013.1 multidrug transporter [Megasphaera cerevisiae DSM 20462]SKA05922.1 hydrophobe/amphiphile efflux-1 (HAE1) family protein [Megasphaera cerevisiae DSM 20462]